MVDHLLRRRVLFLGLGATIVAASLVRPPIREPRAQNLDLPSDGKGNALPGLKKLLDEAERRGKGVVSLPPGRFLIATESESGAIRLPANVRLEGAGMDKTTIIAADGAKGSVINAPYGFVQIADLTVDGNATNRAPGIKDLGANIRLEGDNCVLERVRSANAGGYGIAVGQRRFARNIAIRDVEIVNAGSDGIDMKNRLHQTENILIERLAVRGFGRLVSLFSKEQIRDGGGREHKAGIDLRGSHCVVREVTIEGVREGCDGLRFRFGDSSTNNGPGAHGGIAQHITVRGVSGEKTGSGINVGANGVKLEDIDIEDMQVGLVFLAPDLEIRKGRIVNSAISPLRATRKKGEPNNAVRCADILFTGINRMELQEAQAAFDGCTFSSCSRQIRDALEKNRKVTLRNCVFDQSCAT